MTIYQRPVLTDEFLADLNAAALSRRWQGLPSGMESIGDMLEEQAVRRDLTRVYKEPVYRLDHVRTALGCIREAGAQVGEVMKYLREHSIASDATRAEASYAKRSTIAEALKLSGLGNKLDELEAAFR